MKKDIIQDELTYKIIGCAMKVHTVLGSGFQEVIYQRSLEIEFQKQNIEFLREQQMPIFYEQHQVGIRRVDFFVQKRVLVELKAVSKLDDVHLAQALNYLEAFKMKTGLLINFGGRSLEYQRLFNKRMRK